VSKKSFEQSLTYIDVKKRFATLPSEYDYSKVSRFIGAVLGETPTNNNTPAIPLKDVSLFDI